MQEEWLSAFPVSMPALKPGMLITLITIPWLILLSRTAFHSFVRVVSALLAAIAAIARTVEQVTGEGNNCRKVDFYLLY
jgi:CO/xanthine dehydrogenase FAD-binding subunit